MQANQTVSGGGQASGDLYGSRVLDQYLVFILGGKQYGIDLIKVQEIKEWEEPTPMPGTAEEVRGVLNLRGVVVPVIDMRVKFHLGEAAFTRETVIIVTLIRGKAIGLVVDSVSDVISLTEGQFKAAPTVEGFDSHHMKGIAAMEDGMVILLEADHLLSVEVLESL